MLEVFAIAAAHDRGPGGDAAAVAAVVFVGAVAVVIESERVADFVGNHGDGTVAGVVQGPADRIAAPVVRSDIGDAAGVVPAGGRDDAADAAAAGGVFIDLDVGGDVQVEGQEILGHADPDVADGGVAETGGRGIAVVGPGVVRALRAVEVQIDRAGRAGQALERDDVLIFGDGDGGRMVLRHFLRRGVADADHLADRDFLEDGVAVFAFRQDFPRGFLALENHIAHHFSGHAGEILATEEEGAGHGLGELSGHGDHAFFIFLDARVLAFHLAAVRQFEGDGIALDDAVEEIQRQVHFTGGLRAYGDGVRFMPAVRVGSGGHAGGLDFRGPVFGLSGGDFRCFCGSGGRGAHGGGRGDHEKPPPHEGDDTNAGKAHHEECGSVGFHEGDPASGGWQSSRKQRQNGDDATGGGGWSERDGFGDG